MKNKASLITIFILAAGIILAGCQGGEAPADTSGVKTPEQAAAEGLPTPESAQGAGGGTTTAGSGGAGQAGTMETGA
jgi:hypothetical protein